jgi:hypothetical protein
MKQAASRTAEDGDDVFPQNIRKFLDYNIPDHRIFPPA